MKRYASIVVCGILIFMLMGCSAEKTAKESNYASTAPLQETSNRAADKNTPPESPETVSSENETTVKETAENNEASFYGTWSVKDYQAAAVSALSADEIAAFLDYTVTYQSDAVFQNGQNMNLADLKYESTVYTEEAFVQEYRANLGEWWNEKPEVSYISAASEENFFGSQFFAADENTLWIYYEGVFFLAKKDAE